MEFKKNPNGTWSVRIRTKKGPRSIPTGEKTEAGARAVAKAAKVEELETAAKVTRLQNEVITQLIAGKRVKMSDAVGEWKEAMESEGNLKDRTIANNIYFVRAWLRHQKIEDEPPSFATDKNINNWVNAPDGSKAGTRTVRLSILRQFFDFCSGKGYCIGNPARVVRKINMSKLTHAQKEKREKVAFSDEEITKLLAFIEKDKAKATAELMAIKESVREVSKVAADLRDRLSNLQFWSVAIPLARWSGLRISDICSLEWDTFSKPGVIPVWTEKRDKRVEIPTNLQLIQAIGRIEWKDERYCFPEHRELYTSAKRAQVSSQFARLCERAGITGHIFHEFRNTFAIDAVDRFVAAGKTVDQAVELVKQILGHSSKKTTDIYLAAKRPTPPPELSSPEPPVKPAVAVAPPAPELEPIQEQSQEEEPLQPEASACATA